MIKLLMHPKTATLVEDVVRQPPHALMITGAEGSGKSSLARHIANRLLDTKELEEHPFVKLLDARSGEGITQVRDIRKFLSLKTTGRSAVRRAVLIENADALGADAQNAMLKILEEPPADTVLILTAVHSQHVLATIRSRVRTLQVLPLTKSLCMQVKTYPADAVKSAYALSNGRAGSFIALLKTGSGHSLVEAVSMAKQFLAQKPYERFGQVDELAKDKTRTRNLLVGLEKCLHAAMLSTSDHSIASVHAKLQYVTHAIKAFDKNANTKLLLTSLSINL